MKTAPLHPLSAALMLVLVLAVPVLLQAQPLHLDPDNLDLGHVLPGAVASGQVELTNTSDGDLTVSLAVQGTGFSVDPGTVELAAGAHRRVTVNYVGVELGTFSGELTLEVKGFLKTERFRVALTTTVAPGRLESSPPAGTPLRLAAVDVGSRSSATATVRNVGSVPATLDTVYLAEGERAFSLTAARRVTLQPGEQVGVQVEFQPTQGGDFRERLVLVAPRAVPAQLEVAVHASALAPRVLVSPVPQVGMRFGQVDLGQTRNRTLTVLNTGESTLHVTAVEISGGAFRTAVTVDSLPPMAPGERVEFPVTFAPRYEGQADGRLTLSTTDPANPQITMPLSGSALQSPPQVDVLNEARMDFGSVAVGKSAREYLLLWNRGGAPFTCSMALAGQAPDDFVLGLPSVLLQPGDLRKVAVEFRPRETGQREAELQVQTEAGLQPLRLLGVGKFLELTPTTLDFDQVVVGKTGVVAAEIYNFGNADFTVTNVVSSNPKVFAVQCQVSPGNKFVLAADGTRPLPVSVTFIPGARGVFNGVLQVQGYWDEAFESREILLTGIGIAADIELHPSGPFEFGFVTLGDREVKTIVATNTGDTELRVEAHPEGGEAHIEPAAFQLGPAESTTLKLFFQPAGLGTRNTRVRLISNAVQEKALPLQVTGKGGLDNIDLERVVAVLVSRKSRFDTLAVGWNNTPVVLLDNTKVDLVFRIPPDLRQAMIGRRFHVEWTKLDQNYDPQGGPTQHELQIDDTGTDHLLLEALNLRLLEQGNQRVRLKISTENHAGAPVYAVSQIFEAGGWKWEFEAKPLVSFFSIRPARTYRDRDGVLQEGKTERLIGLPGIAFFGYHNSESSGVSGVHLTAIGNVLEALSTENSIAVSLGVAISFYKDRFMFGIGRDVYDHRSRDKRAGTEDFIMTFKYWGLSK